MLSSSITVALNESRLLHTAPCDCAGPSADLWSFAASHRSLLVAPSLCAAYVFLGGSCDPTTWRADIAVPQFSKHNIPFFNPQISLWNPNLIQLEAKAKEVRVARRKAVRDARCIFGLAVRRSLIARVCPPACCCSLFFLSSSVSLGVRCSSVCDRFEDARDCVYAGGR